MNTPIVSAQWLLTQNNPKIVVLDASMKPSKVFIAGARVFDFDKTISDKTSPLPHMMPTPEEFEREVRRLGINQDSIIVVYDNQGIYSAPRAWWMFRCMGHENVAVLDGGLPEWLADGLPTEDHPAVNVAPGNFKAVQKNLFCDADAVAKALDSKDTYVVDARSSGRFHGTEPEPREGLRPGHMPHALNIPFKEVLDANHLRTLDYLKNVFHQHLPENRKLIFSCGSGVTACILALAADFVGYKNLCVYDGSWSEWGLPSDRPVIQE